MLPARRLLPLAATLLSGVVLVPDAGAAIDFKPCKPKGFACGTLRVPLDRSGATPGTVRLAIKRAVNPDNPTRSALIVLAGGPGQSATPLAPEFAKVFKAGLAQRDLLTIDQRGTGASTLLRCQAIEKGKPANPVTQASACSKELGAKAGFFGTADAAQDIEAVRAELGYDKLVVAGVSYGTKLAQVYAGTFPASTAALVLDSVVPETGGDTFGRETMQALPRIVDGLCGGGRCDGITQSASGDLAALTAKLRTKPLKVGKKAKLTEGTVLSLLTNADLDDAARAEIPAALHAALDGDVRGLARIAAFTAGSTSGPVRELNPTILAATNCADAQNLPYPREASIPDRAKAVEAALAAAPADSFGPFSPKAVPDGAGEAISCLGWRFSNPTPALPVLPKLPTFIVDGQADTRTPNESAQALAADLGPSAQLLTIPFVGHSSLNSDTSGCAAKGLAAFFAGAPLAPCPDAGPAVAIAPVAPLSLNGLATPSGVKGKPGRTVTAAVATLGDALRIVTAEHPVGLSGGRLKASKRTITLKRYAWIPGVTLDGVLRPKGQTVVRVSGRQAARGVLRIGKRSIRGRLGGRRIRVKLMPSAASRLAPLRSSGDFRTPPRGPILF